MPLFHISKENLDKQILVPRTPVNEYTKSGNEDGSTARICMSSSIDGCLAAIFNRPGAILRVYTPKLENTTKVYSNFDIVQNRLVPDAKYTEETWILSPVEFQYVGSIILLDWTSFSRDFRLRYSISDKCKDKQTKEDFVFGFKWEFC